MSSYQSGVRFAAYPASGLALVLSQWIGCQRVVYNAKVAEDQYFWKQYCRTLAFTGAKPPIDQQYAQFKDRELTPWLSEVPSQILRNGAVRWYGAKQRQLKGLAKTPVRKRAHGRQTVLVTNELFRFVDDGQGGHHIELGTVAKPVGRLAFYAHRPYKLPNQIVIAREAGKWYVSFSYAGESAEVLRSEKELAYELNALTDTELEAVTFGGDRGVVQNLAGSDGQIYTPPCICDERRARKDRYVRRQQRKLARQQKGSKNRAKTKQRIARAHQYAANCRRDFAHKTSHALAEAPFRFYVFEALKTEKMSRRPKAKVDENGRYVRNGAAAKAGLNSGIRAAAWGPIVEFTKYKGARRNKLVITVPPHYTSQECSRCGHIHADNRLTQAEFVCQRCGHVENADINAAKVIKSRGIQKLRESQGTGIDAKPVRRVAFRMETPKPDTGVEEPTPMLGPSGPARNASSVARS